MKINKKHKHKHKHKHNHKRSLLLNILTRPKIPSMNEPCSDSVFGGNRAPMKFGVKFWVRPFIPFLCTRVEPYAAGIHMIWASVCGETDKFACFIVLNHRLHFLNLPLTDGAMYCPILVTLTLFVFLPVFDFSGVAAHAFPTTLAFVLMISKPPQPKRMSRDEWVQFGVRVL